MADPTKWTDYADAAIAGLMGLATGVGALFGWNNRRFGKINQQLHSMKNQDVAHGLSIATLQEQHKAVIQRIDRIDEKQDRLEVKQDRQTEILLELKGQMNSKQRGQ